MKLSRQRAQGGHRTRQSWRLNCTSDKRLNEEPQMVGRNDNDSQPVQSANDASDRRITDSVDRVEFVDWGSSDVVTGSAPPPGSRRRDEDTK